MALGGFWERVNGCLGVWERPEDLICQLSDQMFPLSKKLALEAHCDRDPRNTASKCLTGIQDS